MSEAGKTQSEALGRQGQDVITGFMGVVTGRATYISGCAQLLLAPKCDALGQFRESQWFDEQRVQLLDEPSAAVVLDNSATPGPDRAAPKR